MVPVASCNSVWSMRSAIPWPGPGAPLARRQADDVREDRGCFPLIVIAPGISHAGRAEKSYPAPAALAHPWCQLGQQWRGIGGGLVGSKQRGGVQQNIDLCPLVLDIARHRPGARRRPYIGGGEQ